MVTAERPLHVLETADPPAIIGLGIVRAIDTEAGCFFVTTPLPLSALQAVNLLVKGDITIPEKLQFQTQPFEADYTSDAFSSRALGGTKHVRRAVQHVSSFKSKRPKRA
eukprot:m.394456 g.394456  ORF g.394456 m.394456 type:complete len:109 (-) comp56375_c0_seq7:51-377(-)